MNAAKIEICMTVLENTALFSWMNSISQFHQTLLLFYSPSFY